NDNINQISDELKHKKQTFIYITETINRRKVNIIIDTRVEFNLVTKNLTEKLNIDLNRLVSTLIRVVNSIPLGELDDILIILELYLYIRSSNSKKIFILNEESTSEEEEEY